jgi:hypothetical protein
MPAGKKLCVGFENGVGEKLFRWKTAGVVQKQATVAAVADSNKFEDSTHMTGFVKGETSLL